MDTILCSQCGTHNDVGLALCSNCQSPLTAYGGQLRGEAYQGKLAAQTAQLQDRPFAVVLMSATLGVIVFGWPLRMIVSAIIKYLRAGSGESGYVSSAFGILGPILTTAVCLPIAAALCWVAYEVWFQQPRAWRYAFGVLVAFSGYSVVRASEYGYWTIPVLVYSCSLIYLWLRPRARSWFGMS